MTRALLFAGTSALALSMTLSACGRSVDPGGAPPAEAPASPIRPGPDAPALQPSPPPPPPAQDPAVHRAEGVFTTLTYNVAGLPQGVSSAPSDRQSATEAISCYVKPFDLVNVQEDFNYHAALYDACDDHPYRSPTSGGAVFGSGLNTLSRFPLLDWDRVRWDACNGVDCLTPKGFTVARVRLSEGVFVDVYNLHAQAQTADADLKARRANVQQLLDFIELQSAGNAVIVMGDTNTRFTRDGDAAWAFLERGMRDAWVERVRGGAVPAPGAATLSCDPGRTGPDCELVDKVLYRDNGFVGLAPVSYEVRTDAQNVAGQALSDHPPVEVTWRYGTPADRRLSDTWGGPHGDAFNDVSLLPARPMVKSVTLRAAERVDRVEVSLSNGDTLSHGGAGGELRSLALSDGEVLTSLEVCAGKHQGSTRIFYAGFSTTDGRVLAGGGRTDDCTTYRAPPGWQIVGFHGRAGDAVMRLGVVFAPVPSGPDPAAAPPRSGGAAQRWEEVP